MLSINVTHYTDACRAVDTRHGAAPGHGALVLSSWAACAALLLHCVVCHHLARAVSVRILAQVVADAAFQALRPGAVVLGMHKGEAYFARQDVQELHTRERWEREGRQVSRSHARSSCGPHAMLMALKVCCCSFVWAAQSLVYISCEESNMAAVMMCLQVRPAEVDKPAKVVKKRALPAGSGGSGRSSRGGWGPWQRFNSSKSVNSDSAEPTAAAAAATAAADAAAAAAAAGVGGGGGAGVGDSGAKDSTQDAKGEEEDANSMQQLYGLWQTEEFVRQAVAGKVPRNERGNVEVPPLAKTMPLGETCRPCP